MNMNLEILRFDWFIKDCCDIFLPESLCGGDDHDTIFDRHGVQMVDHHVVRLRQKSWFTGERSVFV